jgi:hypothetical protein
VELWIERDIDSLLIHQTHTSIVSMHILHI